MMQWKQCLISEEVSENGMSFLIYPTYGEAPTWTVEQRDEDGHNHSWLGFDYKSEEEAKQAVNDLIAHWRNLWAKQDRKPRG